MEKHRTAKTWGVLVISAFLLAALPLLRPLGMSVGQGLTLGLLMAVILWWATGAVDQTVASLVLLSGFLLFSGVPARNVLTFPFSKDFVLIAVSFLFSQGVLNSGLARRILEPLLSRFAGTAPRLLIAMILCSAVTALFIPQSISRTLIVASLFSDYLERRETPEETRSALLFGLFFTGILVGLLFLRGDIVLNFSLLSISGIALSEWQWILYLAPPTLCILLCSSLLFLLLFRRELKGYRGGEREKLVYPPLTAGDIRNLVLIVATVVLWATEPLHGLSSTWIVVVGTALLVPCGLLGRKDLRAQDGKVLIFLTAAFSIGSVITNSGLAELLFGRLGALLPASFSWKYALAILLCTMGMHLLLGSNVTTLAVSIPLLMTVSMGKAPALVVLFLIYVAVSQHFILPFHHVTLGIGVTKGFFTSRQVLRLGLPMTFLVLAGGVLFYLTWWSLVGILP